MLHVTVSKGHCQKQFNIYMLSKGNCKQQFNILHHASPIQFFVTWVLDFAIFVVFPRMVVTHNFFAKWMIGFCKLLLHGLWAPIFCKFLVTRTVVAHFQVSYGFTDNGRPFLVSFVTRTVVAIFVECFCFTDNGQPFFVRSLYKKRISFLESNAKFSTVLQPKKRPWRKKTPLEQIEKIAWSCGYRLVDFL